MTGWDDWVAQETDRIRAARQWRDLRVVDGGEPGAAVDGRPGVVSFASNDYLGLSQHPAVRSAANAAIERWGTGAGSSRLIVGTRPGHVALEEALASWRETEAALVFATGYHANLAVLCTFGAAGVRIVSDELNHASLIDGARLARAEVAVYRHRDIDHAASLVAATSGRAIVVSDTVFSMDGDVAPVAELSSLCARHGALLVLDDAHLVFDVDAPDPDAACLRIGTLSKTLGSLGGYVAGPRAWVDLLVNRARTFIFTTGLAPASVAAAHVAVELVRAAEGACLRARLQEHVHRLRPGHPSPVVPVVVGSEQAALTAAAKLLEQGLLVPAIRPPTVPPGTSRLRVSLSAAHTLEDVERLAIALRELTCSSL